jgi:hypothetical protein
MIAEFAVYTAYTSILKVPANQSIQTPWVDMMGVMARYVAFVIIGKNIKVDESERKYIFWLRFLYPAITLLLILKIYQIISLTEVKAYGIEWICVLLMIATIVSFKIIDDMADLIRNNERYKKAIAENSLNLDRYEELEKEENAWKKREHDLAKYLSAIGGLAEEKKDNEIIEVLEGMQIEIKSLRKTQYIENGVINALLRVKLSEAESKGISVDFYAEPNLGISTFEIADLIAIIGNQLDNAIEAAQLCREKKIIWARYYCTDDRKIVFEMENSYERDMYKWKVIEKAREKGGVHHGLGMRIIDETVRRYGGFYGVEKEDKCFRSVIVLPREKVA